MSALASLDGRVAIVTGAASGIGAATARRLASDGARVVVTDVDDESGAELAAGIGATFAHLDVGDADAWEDLVDRTTTELGPVELAHLNAGIALGAYPVVVEALTEAQYRRILAVNVDGVFYGIRAVVPRMAAGGGGAIVATSSLAGVAPHPDDPIYAATKHFVIGLVRSLGRPLRKHGITINAVCPGAVDTPLLDTTERRGAIEARGRPLMDPDEVAAVVTSLMAGDETGQVYTVMQGRGGECFEPPEIPGMPGT